MTTFKSVQKSSGNLGIRVIKAPKASLSWTLRNRLRPEFIKGWIGYNAAGVFSKAFGIVTIRPKLYARLIRADGTVVNYGMVGIGRVVTTAWVNFMVDQLQTDTTEWGDLKFHDSGIGTTPAAVGDTNIETTDGEARASGSQEEGASANIYKSIGTISYTTTKAITEHGLFTHLTAGTMIDRHVFAAINVENGDSIQFTYEYTCTAGG